MLYMFAHKTQAEMLSGLRTLVFWLGEKARAIVTHLYGERSREYIYTNDYLAGMSMLTNVVERFLDKAEDGVLQCRRNQVRVIYMITNLQARFIESIVVQ